MSTRPITNLPASVHGRLLHQAKENREEFSFVLMRYGVERLLYRLSVSSYAEHFVLKGAMLFSAWIGQPHRPTKDVDLLGLRVLSQQQLKQAFQDICRADAVPDGLRFDAESIRVVPIRDVQAHGGWRVSIQASMGRSRVPLQIDVGFGDAVVPEPREMQYPGLLDFPAPRVLAYPPETVVAEKLEAMVSLGMASSRMGDLYDLLWMAEHFSFEGATLTRAIESTFDQRQTAAPQQLPTVLTDEFGDSLDKIAQWNAFLESKRLGARRSDLRSVIDGLRTFLLPPLQAVSSGREFKLKWPQGGPWPDSVSLQSPQ